METHFQGVKQSNKQILMKVTSRERPAQLLSTVEKYIQLANNTTDMVWLFSFDEDDDSIRTVDFNQAIIKLLEPTGRGIAVTEKSESKIHANNRDVNQFPIPWDILLNISDDQIPVVKGYDDYIRRAMPDDLDASLWFNDGVQPRINTQEIVGRKYYDRFGYIYHPGYKSFFCDNEATEVAALLGKQIKSKQCIIKHEHYAAGFPQKKDALYTRNDKFWAHDESLYNQRKKINFGL